MIQEERDTEGVREGRWKGPGGMEGWEWERRKTGTYGGTEEEAGREGEREAQGDRGTEDGGQREGDGGASGETG